jgi:sigma-E factor negative regulatory protein RseA
MEKNMSTESERNVAALERLSALVDGELDGAAVAQACGQWRQSAEIRSSWHAYHVIGDVLRSSDLAAAHPARDLQFLEALRVRLEAEPVVLAPGPLAAAGVAPARAVGPGPVRHASWLLPSAVAAGFVAVAGFLMLGRGPGASTDASAGPELARLGPPQHAPAAAPGQDVSSTSTVDALVAPLASASEPSATVASGQLIRDARLDRYLTAHKQFAGSSALGVPSGFLRNATAIESAR